MDRIDPPDLRHHSFSGVVSLHHRGSRPWIKTSFPAISDWNSLKIALSRGPCLGTCPVYRVSIDGAGNVVFEGEVPSVPPPAYGMDHRIYRSKISEASVHELFAAFQKAQFFWLHNRYASGVTDSPWHTVSIEFDGHKKEVIDYVGRAVGMPKDVTDLEIMIDHIAGTRKLLTFAGAPPAPDPGPSEPLLVKPKPPKYPPPEIVIEGTGTPP